MRRPMIVLVAVATALLVTATVALAVSVDDARDDRPRPGMHQRADDWWPGADRDPGDRPGGWMGRHDVVASEADYLREMVAHHQEAVAAATELERSDRARMRAFGRSIVATQSLQIDRMESWLTDWYPSQPDPAYHPMMRDLTELSGDRLDRAFLQDMVGHHMLAVMMSQQLLVRGIADHEEVAALAEDIRDEQRDEIFLMQRWLSAWFDASGVCAGWGGGTWMALGPRMMR